MMAFVLAAMAERCAELEIENTRLRDIVWCNGDPGTINNYTQPECFFCRNRNDGHDDDCVWLMEEEYRLWLAQQEGVSGE